MPYITEKNRAKLDAAILTMISSLEVCEDNMTNEQFLQILGDINYCFSRVLGNLMGQVSYSKVAMITGVLENIKQEFYRRVAASYEDSKIQQNGDIKEYKNLK